MTTDILDADFQYSDNLHPLERLGFVIVQNIESRVWSGKSNIYIDSLKFHRIDTDLGEWFVQSEARKSEIGHVLFNKVNGSINLLPEFIQLKRSIKSIYKFWFIRKPKNLIDRYYSIDPAIDSDELLDLLISLKHNINDIQIEDGLVNFEFNFEHFEDENYDQIIQVLTLVIKS